MGHSRSEKPSRPHDSLTKRPSCLDLSELGCGTVGFVGARAALVDGGFVVVRSVEDGSLLVRAFGEEAGQDVLASKLVRKEIGEVQYGGMVRTWGQCIWCSLSHLWGC